MKSLETGDNLVIINAFGRSNRGDAVLLDECIDEIRSAPYNWKIFCSLFEGRASAAMAWPEISWSDRIGNTRAEGTFAGILTLFRLAIAVLATAPGLGILSFFLPTPQRETWNQIRAAKLVVSAPGGYIHDTNFSYYIAILHIWLGINAGAKVVLAPQSIGPIDSKIGRRIAAYVLSRVTAICARESYTQAFLVNELGLPSELIKRSGDSAFWNFKVEDNKDVLLKAKEEIGIVGDGTSPLLGITVVDWTFPEATDVHGARDRYVSAMADVIDYFCNRHNMQAVIFNQVSDDLPMARRIAEKARSCVLIDQRSRSPEILRGLISESTLFLGTRFHSCIFSMMAGRPTFAVAYLPKTSFILKDLKLEHRQISIYSISPGPVICQLESDLSELENAEAEIESAVDVYRRTHARLRDVLGD